MYGERSTNGDVRRGDPELGLNPRRRSRSYLSIQPASAEESNSLVRENLSTSSFPQYPQQIILHKQAEQAQPLLGQLAGVLRLLQIFGLYPSVIVRSRRSGSNCSRCGKFLEYGILFPMSFFFLFLNLVIFAFNMFLTHKLRQDVGLLHAKTITSVITGLLPLHNFLNFLNFVLCVNEHKRLLWLLESLETTFRIKFHRRPPIKKIKIIVYLSTGVFFVVPLAFRFVQWCLTGPPLGVDWISDSSFVLAPLLRMWQLLPLFYFELISCLIRFWFRSLEKLVRQDYNNRVKPMAFYYKQFLQLTVVTRRVGDWLNPFIMYSLFLNVIVLCLAIYFFIQADTIIPTDMNAQAMTTVIFNLGWAGIQIVIAFIYILLIAGSGRKTNEEARTILHSVLASQPDTEDDRFQVIRFVQKVSTQYAWGITVWRAFPIERSLLFTLVSTISAYSLILNRLKPHTACAPCNPQNAIAAVISTGIMENVTEILPSIPQY